MCNDSGSGAGPSIQYQQVNPSGAFGSNPVSITSETFDWNYAQPFGGNGTLLGGNIAGYLSTTEAQMNNPNADCLSCNVGEVATHVFDFTIPGRGIPFGQSYTINNSTPFLFNPSEGNLLLDIFVSNQDLVPNDYGNSYNDATDLGTLTSRAFAFNGNDSRFSDNVGW